MKIGRLVRENMRQISKLELLQNEDIDKLTDEGYSKEIFNLNYPFMKRINKARNLKEQRLVNNHSRYWSEVFNFYGKEYYICSEWYENSNRRCFEKWLNEVLSNILI